MTGGVQEKNPRHDRGGGGDRHLGTEDRKNTENNSFLLKLVRERTPRFDINEFEKFFTI